MINEVTNMPEEEGAVINKLRSMQIKAGIARVKAQGKKLGRPTIQEIKRNPTIINEAAELRANGLSWSQIASHLKVSRSTARRLVESNQKENNFVSNGEEKPSMPKTNVLKRPLNESQNIDPALDNDVFSQFPKSFKIFSSLLEKAKKAQEK